MMNIRDFRFWATMFFVGLLLCIMMPAWADNGHGHDHGGGETTVDTEVNTSVPVSVDVAGGDSPVNVSHDSKAFALSNTLGDVDIAGCLGSTQWATPLFSKQKLVVNWPCLTEFYLRNGKYQLAAMAICNTEVVKEFETEEACEAAHDFGPLLDPEPVGEVLEEFDQEQAIQDDRIEVVQMAQNELEQRIMALEQKPRPRVVRAAAPKPEPAFTEEQKRAAWLALTGEGDGEDE
jgi:hypothetical protein